MVGHARFSPWLSKQADLQMGHLLEQRFESPASGELSIL
jgi:hypothetical protein